MIDFKELMSFTEAAKCWGLHPATLRRAIEYGRLKPDIDCKLFGHQWIVTEKAMLKVFGEKPLEADKIQRRIPISEISCKSDEISAEIEIN